MLYKHKQSGHIIEHLHDAINYSPKDKSLNIIYKRYKEDPSFPHEMNKKTGEHRPLKPEELEEFSITWIRACGPEIDKARSSGIFINDGNMNTKNFYEQYEPYIKFNVETYNNSFKNTIPGITGPTIGI